MTDSQQSNQYTRLRDFGAFRENIAIINTHKLIAIGKSDHPNSSSEYALTPPQDIVEMATDLMPVCDPGLIKTFEKSSPHPGSATIIQFPVPDTKSPWEQAPFDSPMQSVSQHPIALDTQKKKKRISFGFRVGITLLIFVFLFKSLSWTALLQALTHVSYGKLLLGLIVGGFSIVISSYQWRSLLRAERIHYDLAELIDLYLVGIAFSHFLPTGMGGDVIKAIHVGRESKNSAGSASAVVMSRVTGFFGMLLIAMPVLLIWHSGFSSSVLAWFLILSLLVGGMIGGTIFVAALLPRFAKGKWAKYRIMASAAKIGSALQNTAKHPRSLLFAILIGAEFWLVGCLNYYAYGLALGIHIHLYFYFVAIPFVSLVTFLPISINGFGVREGAFVFIFSAAHVAPALALLLAIFMDAQVLLFGVIGGAIYINMGKQKNTQKASQQRIA